MAEQFTWTAADGTVIDFTDEAAGYSILADGTRGLRSVPWDFTASTYAGIDGETITNVRAAAGQVTLGLMVRANGETDLRSRVRGLVRAMRPHAGFGVLAVKNESGEARSLNCYGAGGLEGDEAKDAILTGSWWRVALKLYAPDPWWYGEQRSISVGLGVPTTFFPIFPLRLSPSTVQGAFSVDLSDTDTPSFPVWTITGPGTSLILTNLTTGQTLELSMTLTAGQSMVIDTRPGFRSIRREDGTNLLSAVSGEPRLWPLVESLNDITAVLADATVDSRIEGSYQPRYAGI